MSNFKSGSGDLDFGGTDESEDDADSGSAGEDRAASDTEAGTGSETEASDAASGPASGTRDSASETPEAEETQRDGESTDAYPYFVRRNNVGDERDTRLEIHVRDKVADREAQFRSELAAALDASEVSKTDAREFALLAAYHNPERVAELMEEEGFGAL